MNLQVNLLVPSEQRSASPVNVKFIKRMVRLAVPTAIALVIASAITDVLTMKSQLRRMEERWADLEPKKKAAQQRQVAIMRNRDILAEIKGWANARNEWHLILPDMFERIPPSIQIRTMTVSQDTPLIGKKVPARVFQLQLTGKAKGENSEQDIQTLRRRFDEIEAVSSARVSNYGADYSANADEHDRVFSIVCVFVPRKFE